MLLSVSKNRMRQMIDSILKRTGRDKTTTDGFKLRGEHGEAPKPEPVTPSPGSGPEARETAGLVARSGAAHPEPASLGGLKLKQ